MGSVLGEEKDNEVKEVLIQKRRLRVVQLILSGNPNLDAIRNVVHFASREFDKSIEKVHFIDNEHSLQDGEGGTVEAERNGFVRECIPGVQVTK